MVGRVSLVGAGPGDPELITMKAMRILREADVIIHDSLIAQELLDEAKEGAELVDATKTREVDNVKIQHVINDTMLDRVQKGLHVARLKGGDPYIYGRATDEAIFCYEHNIPCEVIPGVSNLQAVTAAAGIPLTVPGFAGRFLTMIGYDNPTKEAYTINYDALAHVGATIVLFMTRMEDMKKIFGGLVEAGADPAKPATLIYRGATPEQEVLVGTLDTLVAMVEERWGDTPNPSLIVIGDTIPLRDQLPHLPDQPEEQASDRLATG